MKVVGAAAESQEHDEKLAVYWHWHPAPDLQRRELRHAPRSLSLQRVDRLLHELHDGALVWTADSMVGLLHGEGFIVLPLFNHSYYRI